MLVTGATRGHFVVRVMLVTAARGPLLVCVAFKLGECVLPPSDLREAITTPVFCINTAF